jgi:rod shape-determining protein MreB
VANKSIKIAGDDFNSDIVEYMGRMHNLRIDEPTAERIKIAVGSALPELDEPLDDYVVIGPNKVTALPMTVPVSYQEIAHCLEKSIAKVENAVLQALESTPPELYADIVKRGIFLAGGGALLHGLAKRLSDKITIPFYVADDPLHAVARGTGIALKNVHRFAFLIR